MGIATVYAVGMSQQVASRYSPFYIRCMHFMDFDSAGIVSIFNCAILTIELKTIWLTVFVADTSSFCLGTARESKRECDFSLHSFSGSCIAVDNACNQVARSVTWINYSVNTLLVQIFSIRMIKNMNRTRGRALIQRFALIQRITHITKH